MTESPQELGAIKPPELKRGHVIIERSSTSPLDKSLVRTFGSVLFLMIVSRLIVLAAVIYFFILANSVSTYDDLYVYASDTSKSPMFRSIANGTYIGLSSLPAYGFQKSWAFAPRSCFPKVATAEDLISFLFTPPDNKTFTLPSLTVYRSAFNVALFLVIGLLLDMMHYLVQLYFFFRRRIVDLARDYLSWASVIVSLAISILTPVSLFLILNNIPNSVYYPATTSAADPNCSDRTSKTMLLEPDPRWGYAAIVMSIAVAVTFLNIPVKLFLKRKLISYKLANSFRLNPVNKLFRVILCVQDPTSRVASSSSFASGSAGGGVPSNGSSSAVGLYCATPASA
jgi:hypothetical protein